MQRKYISVLFWAAAIFTTSCGNGGTTKSGPNNADSSNCATSAQLQQVPIIFGDPGTDTVSGQGGGCNNQGICVVGSTSTINPIPVNVTAVYMQSTNATPSTFTMSFMYQSLLTNQQSAATLFYNNAPIATYQFVNNFALSKLGGAFANVCGTINATPAGAGVISYVPLLSQQKPPKNADMNSQVVVTFTVTP